MIELKNISIRYKKWILKDAYMKIPDCQVTLIKGLSGTGKTSLLYRIGLIAKKKGYLYFWDEVNVSRLSFLKKNKVRRHHIGYVFQDFCLFEDFSIYENLEYYCKVAHKEIDEKKARQLLQSVQLDNELSQSTKTLSNGEKQRLAIACALTKDPELLVLDEPTSALDEDNERNVFSILRTLAHEQGKTIVIASHSYIADDYADCIYTIENGDIVSQKYEECHKMTKIKKQNKSISHFISYYSKKYFHKHIFMNVLMIMIIVLGCLSSIYIQSIIQQTLNEVDSKINNLSDHQILVMNKETSLYSMFDGEPISQTIVDDIRQRKGVKSVYPLYDLKVYIDDKEYAVYPLFQENQLDGKLYKKNIDERHAYLSYTIYYQSDLSKISEFKFNDDIHLTKPIEISGIFSIGEQSEYNNSLNYIMMDYDEIVKLAKENNVNPSYSVLAIFFKSIEDLETERKNIYDKYHFEIVEGFQDSQILGNMKTQTVATMNHEKVFVKVLTLLLFLYLGYWNMKSREKEFVLLHINGVSHFELSGIMMIDLFVKLLISFVLTFIVGYILSIINILQLNYVELINYYITIIGFITIAMMIMICLFIMRLNPERTLRN